MNGVNVLIRRTPQKRLLYPKDQTPVGVGILRVYKRVKSVNLESQKDQLRVSVLAVDDRHVAFCEYNGNVVRIICVALVNEKLLELASDNDLLLCRKSTSNKICYRQ